MLNRKKDISWYDLFVHVGKMGPNKSRRDKVKLKIGENLYQLALESDDSGYVNYLVAPELEPPRTNRIAYQAYLQRKEG